MLRTLSILLQQEKNAGLSLYMEKKIIILNTQLFWKSQWVYINNGHIYEYIYIYIYL